MPDSNLLSSGNMLYSDLTYKIIGASMNVYNYLGRGFSEHIYQDALQLEFNQLDIPYIREAELRVMYKGVELKSRFYADFLCYDKIIVELKVVSELDDMNRHQTLNYLKASGLRVGLLINFGYKNKLQHERFIL